MSANKSEPAFPVVGHFYGDKLGGQLFHGLTMRDYFAAKAMPVYLQLLNQWRPDGLGEDDIREVAYYSYELADAMLKARDE